MTVIDRSMSVILMRLELLPNGSVQAWNPSGGHSGEPDDRVVAQLDAEEPLHLEYRRLYSRQTSDRGRCRVLRAAQDELDRFKRRTAALGEDRSLSELILEDGLGFEPEVVAHRFRVAGSYVRRLRGKYGRDPETGRVVDVVGGGAVRARELRAKGMSTRQIATVLSVHQTQVMRWTRSQ